MKKSLPAILVLTFLAMTGLALAEEATENFNEGVTSPYLIPSSRVAPEYPPAAFDARIEGSVTSAVLVLRDGSVGHIETLESSHPSLGFEKAAASAIEQWRFEPGSKDGEIIDAFSVVRLQFNRTAGASPSGYVSAGFVPLDMLGASIVASMVPTTGTASQAGGVGLAFSPEPTSGGYHPRIPPGLYPGAAYLRSDWWPKRERNFGDASNINNPEFDANHK